MACSWRAFMRVDGATGKDGDCRGSACNWLVLYVEDAYWVMMTMTTVGYGDVFPRGTAGRVYAMLAMLVASIFFGTVISALTHVTQELFDNEAEKRVAEVSRFMSGRRVPAELQRRVQHNLRHRLRHASQKAVDPLLFELLSPAVQRDLSLSCLSDVVLQFPLFKGAQHAFVAELAQAHLWVHCLTGDLVAEDGQTVQEVAFVIRGRLTVRFGPGSQGWRLDAPVKDVKADRSLVGAWPNMDIEAGAWFGESSVFDQSRIRTARVLASSESELAVLAAPEYIRIVEKYPLLLGRHRKLQKAVVEGRLSLDGLAYKPEPVDDPTGSNEAVSTASQRLFRIFHKGDSRGEPAARSRSWPWAERSGQREGWHWPGVAFHKRTALEPCSEGVASSSEGSAAA